MAKIVLKHVRCSFPDIFKPRSFNGQDPKYSVQLLIKKDHPQMDELQRVVLEAARDKWPSKVKGNEFPKGLKNPLRDGDERDTEQYPQYLEHWFVNSNTKLPPLVVGSRKGENGKFPVLSEGDIQGGDYINVVLNSYAYDNTGNKGVALGLEKIQFVAKGERLGGSRTSAEDDFEDEVGEDDLLA